MIMKRLIRFTCGAALLGAMITAGFSAGTPEAGYVDFGKFSPPSAGGEFVEVHINSNLISMASRLAERHEPEIADLLHGLQLIRVNVIGLNKENRVDVEKRVKTIRSELDAQGWERVVTAQKNGEDVGVYVKTRGEEAVQGLVVMVLGDKKEAVLVNIVGDIKPEKLAVIGERFNIEPLKKAGRAVQKK